MDIDNTLIEAAIQDLLQVRGVLEAKRTRLSNHIGDLDHRIALWREKLADSSTGAPNHGPLRKDAAGRRQNACVQLRPSSIARSRGVDFPSGR